MSARTSTSRRARSIKPVAVDLARGSKRDRVRRSARPISGASKARSPRVVPKHEMMAQHSAANPAWGTPAIVKMLATRVLAPASDVAVPIELDYASSAYWNMLWPEECPLRFLDGKRGRDVLVDADRFPTAMPISTGFFNAPGLDGGRMIQRCWDVFVGDYAGSAVHGATSKLDSGVWVGFSIEQTASLQNVEAPFHPLSPNVTTLVPSRRFRYLLHPLEMIEIWRRKLKKATAAKDAAKVRYIRGEIETLQERKDDRPVVGDAPPHASYVTILWSHDEDVRDEQREALRAFLKEQAAIAGSAFERCAVLGVQP